MIKELWNVGLKVTDLDREVAFLREVGATLVLRERVPLVGEEREYAILVLGGVRMLLFETVVFEDLVAGGVQPGLTHAVYEVDDLDAEYARIRALGAEVLIEPTEVATAFGRRRLAFFRSPSGFVFELMQVLERRSEFLFGDKANNMRPWGRSRWLFCGQRSVQRWVRRKACRSICTHGSFLRLSPVSATAASFQITAHPLRKALELRL